MGHKAEEGNRRGRAPFEFQFGISPEQVKTRQRRRSVPRLACNYPLAVPPAQQSSVHLPVAWAAMAASIWAFTASRLKLAPFCMGGKSIAVFASSPTTCCTNTKRQN